MNSANQPPLPLVWSAPWATLMVCACLSLLSAASGSFVHPNHHAAAILKSPTTTSSSSSGSLSMTASPLTTNESSRRVPFLSNVAIVGAGPSGLLLAHRLLHDQVAQKVTLYESRSDPRSLNVEGRAYALGLGMRGRTAIQSVDAQLWNAVKQRGFECERFTLYVGPFGIKLRDNNNDGNKKRGDGPDPSVLMYQSDLCAAMLDELETRYASSKSQQKLQQLSIQFNQRVTNCDIKTMSLQVGDNSNDNKSTTTTTTTTTTTAGPFDLIVGCDGVNSVIRQSLVTTYSAVLQVEQRVLPGEYKVVRLSYTPPKIDPNSVALIVPKAGTTTAFVEPTANQESCVLFATNSNSSTIVHADPSNVTALEEALLTSYPRLEGCNMTDIALQLLRQKTARASSVVCNTYHAASKNGKGIVLVGDAAHATGGVSGQGVNSALVDASVLANCIKEHGHDSGDIQSALLRYSQYQVPEGKALYDLSFGPKPSSGWKRVQNSFRQLRDTVFQGRLGLGRPPLQTQMTTSLISFSELRRQLEYYYDTEFPSQEHWNEVLQELDDKMKLN